MTKIRLLNEEGLNKFEDFLRSNTKKADVESPFYLLEDDETSYESKVELSLDKIKKLDLYDLSLYIAEEFKSQSILSLLINIKEKEKEFWNSISLHAFDTIKDSKSLQEVAKYALTDFGYGNYKHLIRTSFHIAQRLGEEGRPFVPKNNSRPDITDKLFGGQRLIRYGDLPIKLALDIYLDKSTNKLKNGKAKVNDVKILLRYLNQIAVNFYLPDLDYNKVYDNLPKVFDNLKYNNE